MTNLMVIYFTKTFVGGHLDGITVTEKLTCDEGEVESFKRVADSQKLVPSWDEKTQYTISDVSVVDSRVAPPSVVTSVKGQAQRAVANTRSRGRYLLVGDPAEWRA